MVPNYFSEKSERYYHYCRKLKVGGSVSLNTLLRLSSNLIWHPTISQKGLRDVIIAEN